jgi:putative transposase
MYDGRRMTVEEQNKTLARRKFLDRPWHSPPHRSKPGRYLFSAACFEHKPHIAYSAERMDHFADMLIATITPVATEIFAWCVLPDHYHILFHTESPKRVVQSLGRYHGRTSYIWNTEENKRGRQVWFACTDRQMRSGTHFWTTVNYVHHNPVKHGYVERWQDWLWSSAATFLEKMGRERTVQIWRDFPVKDYGGGWDDVRSARP